MFQFPDWRLMCEWFGWCATAVTGKRCRECCWGRWVKASSLLWVVKWDCFVDFLLIRWICWITWRFDGLQSLFIFFKNRPWNGVLSGRCVKMHENPRGRNLKNGLVKFPNRKWSTRGSNSYPFDWTTVKTLPIGFMYGIALPKTNIAPKNGGFQ